MAGLSFCGEKAFTAINLKIMELKRTEAQLKTEIIKALTLKPRTKVIPIQIAGIPIIKNKKVTGFRKNQTKGCSDILGCKDGRFFAMEVKLPNGLLEHHQKEFLLEVDFSGGYACVVRSVSDALSAWEEI